MSKKVMNPPKVIRVTAQEFELEDGRIFPHAIELSEDEVPSVEEFQKIYDRWWKILKNEVKGTHGEIG